jgi:hypothetical protein
MRSYSWDVFVFGGYTITIDLYERAISGGGLPQTVSRCESHRYDGLSSIKQP